MTNLLHHQVDGAGGAPPLVLGPSLGTSLAVWDAQVPALARTHRVIRYDLPGHGRSPARLPATGATVADLGRMVLELADRLGVESFAYGGVSLGGAVGTWLAVHHAERVRSLALVCTSARFGEPSGWRERAALVRAEGTGPVADTAVHRWFTPAFAGARPRRRWWPTQGPRTRRRTRPAATRWPPSTCARSWRASPCRPA